MNAPFPKNTDGPQRRLFLRGALAACCAVAMSGRSAAAVRPAPASGSTTQTASETGAHGATPTIAQGSAKMSKATAQYQEQPKGEQKCSSCQHFIAASNTCQVVDGPINPNGWCMLWVLRQG